MKTYVVQIQFSHESFGGYEHNDGSEQFEVTARNEKSARTKALKQARQQRRGYESRIISTYLVDSPNGFVNAE
jgi:hypothetical protein